MTFSAHARERWVERFPGECPAASLGRSEPLPVLAWAAAVARAGRRLPGTVRRPHRPFRYDPVLKAVWVMAGKTAVTVYRLPVPAVAGVPRWAGGNPLHQTAEGA